MKFRGRNIRSKLLVSYAVLFFITVVIFLVLYVSSRNTIQKVTIQNSLYTTEVLSEKINSELEYLLTVKNQIYNNSNVNRQINGIRSSEDSMTRHYHIAKLNSTVSSLTQILIQDDKSVEVILFSPTEGFLYYPWTTINNPDPLNSEAASQIQGDISALFPQNSGRVSHEMLRASYNPGRAHTPYLYFYQVHKNPYSGLRDYYIIIGVSQESLDRYLAPGGQTNAITLLASREGRILYANPPEAQKQLVGLSVPAATSQTVSYGGEEYYQLCVPLQVLGWYQIQLLPVRSVLRDLNYWSGVILAALAILAAGMAAACLYLNRSIVYPIKQLDRDIQLAKAGKTRFSPVHLQAVNEIERLNVEFYDMMEQQRLLQEQMLLKEKQKRRLEIEALQAQINPHFMYNTIGSIKMLLLLGRTSQAVSSLSALVDILKHTIARAEETISLEEECRILNSYIYIQKIRYAEFQFEIVLPEELKKYRIMRFIIQPFIENSLLHGYEEIDAATRISVFFFADFSRQCLEVSIEDNGCGITEKALQEILLGTEKRHGLNGIGIRNIVDRLRLTYGDPYSVHFSSRAPHGTKVLLTLPLLLGKEDSDHGAAN